MANSIGKQAACKPDKPYPDFPLFPHATKRWAKKIKGRLHYFGPWDDWQAALERFQYENDYLQQGKKPPPRNQTALTVGDLVNSMLDHRKAKVESGEMSQRSWTDYERVGKFLIAALGRHTSVECLTAADFTQLRAKMAKRMGLVTLGNEIGRIRVFFNFAFKHDLIDKPVKMGLGFDKPSKKSLKREKQSKTAKVFTIEELQTLYQAADAQLKAFMLLALNGGLGNGDIGQLEFRHIQSGWIVYPRPKTLVDRRFPMWKETAKAIEQAKQSKHPELPFVFVTKYGQCWYKDANVSPLSAEFRKLCVECGLHETGRGFYSLRHQFRTVADGCRDQVAINHVMGHSDDSMAATYREWIEPERLQAVVDHVYAWVKPMFRKPAKKKAVAK
jgi:integrase